MIDGVNLPEGVASLGMDKINLAYGQGLTNVVIKGIGIKIAVNARDGNHHRIRFLGGKQHALQRRALLG